MRSFVLSKKEKLVTIISNLQNMSTEVGLKVAEHISEYYDICKDALTGLFALQNDATERSAADAQKVFDSFNKQEALLEKLISEAKTERQRSQYLKKAE